MHVFRAYSGCGAGRWRAFESSSRRTSRRARWTRVRTVSGLSLSAAATSLTGSSKTSLSTKGTRNCSGIRTIAPCTASKPSRSSALASGDSLSPAALTVVSAKGVTCDSAGMRASRPPKRRRCLARHRRAAITYIHVPAAARPWNVPHFRCAWRNTSCTRSSASCGSRHIRRARARTLGATSRSSPGNASVNDPLSLVIGGL
jgi:hypothetical protein